jgi:hypothetical protein
MVVMPLPLTMACSLLVMMLIRLRVANLGDFSPKNPNLGIFLAFGEMGDFWGNFESHLS